MLVKHDGGHIVLDWHSSVLHFIQWKNIKQNLRSKLGLNEIYVWFLLPTYPIFFNPTLNIKMVFGEKLPKMGTFSDFVTIFFAKCYTKFNNFPTYLP